MSLGELSSIGSIAIPYSSRKHASAANQNNRSRIEARPCQAHWAPRGIGFSGIREESMIGLRTNPEIALYILPHQLDAWRSAGKFRAQAGIRLEGATF